MSLELTDTRAGCRCYRHSEIGLSMPKKEIIKATLIICNEERGTSYSQRNKRGREGGKRRLFEDGIMVFSILFVLRLGIRNGTNRFVGHPCG